MPSADLPSEKRRLRRGANARGMDSAADRARQDAELARRFLDAFPPDPKKSLSFFWPMARECDTRPIATACHESGMTVALPVVRTDVHGLLFRVWAPDAPMARSNFGTLEPLAAAAAIDPDILLIPLVMIDLHGTRLGRGAGHYDATLGPLRARKNVLALGVAYDWQVSEDTLPHETHDVRLDGLVTPSRVIVFP